MMSGRPICLNVVDIQFIAISYSWDVYSDYPEC